MERLVVSSLSNQNPSSSSVLKCHKYVHEIIFLEPKCAAQWVKEIVNAVDSLKWSAFMLKDMCSRKCPVPECKCSKRAHQISNISVARSDQRILLAKTPHLAGEMPVDIVVSAFAFNKQLIKQMSREIERLATLYIFVRVQY